MTLVQHTPSTEKKRKKKRKKNRAFTLFLQNDRSSFRKGKGAGHKYFYHRFLGIDAHLPLPSYVFSTHVLSI